MEKINEKPLVSIIIPVYNGANYVAQAIDSALAQTYENVEIIVVNDGSRDDGATEQVVLSYGDKIRYLYKENGGVSSALNVGISNMHGEYFSWLSHDDIYHPDKVKKSLAAITDNKTIALCGSSHIDAKGNPIHLVSRKATLKKHYSGIEMFERCFLKKHAINGSGLLIPKQAFLECGGFSDLIFAQDMECWARMMMKGYSFNTIPDSLSITRIHAQQGTNKIYQVYFKELPNFYDKMYRFAISLSENRDTFLRMLLLTCYSNIQYSKSTADEIEKYVSVNFVKKYSYLIKWNLLNTAKKIYHAYKYRTTVQK